jgi:hypothetical protein
VSALLQVSGQNLSQLNCKPFLMHMTFETLPEGELAAARKIPYLISRMNYQVVQLC